MDSRKSDELILLDISGSMVRDIRAAMLKLGLGRGETDNDRFKLASGVTIKAALADPRLQEVIRNNLLYKTIQYAEAIIDQPGPRNIYFVTFDDGPRILGKNLPKQLDDGFFGPFVIDPSDADPNSPARRQIKSFLAPDRYGPYGAALEWSGILAEAVVKGSGPTAIHETCRKGVLLLGDMIKNVPGYTNKTRLQRMVLFTDGIEEKDRKRGFEETVKLFTLQRNKIAFEFEKYFILPDNTLLPKEIVEENRILISHNFVPIQTLQPRTLYVTPSSDAAVLSGQVEEPEDALPSVTTQLSPGVRFEVSATDKKPVKGKLHFRAYSPEMQLTVEPVEVSVDQLGQPVAFSVTFKGSDIKRLAQGGIKKYDRLWLAWGFFPESQDSRGMQVGQAFYGTNTWRVAIELLPFLRPIEVKCTEPAGITLATGKRLELSAASRQGTAAAFSADFSRTRPNDAMVVRLSNTGKDNWLKLDSGNGDQLTLTKSAGDDDQKKFAVLMDGLPGSYNAEGMLEFLPQSKRNGVTPGNVPLSIQFAPTVAKVEWLTETQDPAQQPDEINFGLVYMKGVKEVREGIAQVAQKPKVDHFLLEIPEKAISPAVECKITGPNAEAFRLLTKGDAGEVGATVFNRSVQLGVQVQHVFVDVTRPLNTNFTAVLEITPKANFVFETRAASESLLRTNRISIPLRMNAIIQPPE